MEAKRKKKKKQLGTSKISCQVVQNAIFFTTIYGVMEPFLIFIKNQELLENKYYCFKHIRVSKFASTVNLQLQVFF